MKLKTRIIMMCCYPFMVYLAILNAMEWEEYKWQWSDSNSVLALQYMINAVWFISTIGLPIICILYLIFVLTNGFK